MINPVGFAKNPADFDKNPVGFDLNSTDSENCATYKMITPILKRFHRLLGAKNTEEIHAKSTKKNSS